MKKIITLVLLLYLFNVNAGDLDDGIKADTPINDDINIDKNIPFIIRKAKTAATLSRNGKNLSNNVIVNKECSGTGNQNFGAGSNLRGATIVNLSDNQGISSVCKK